VVLSPHRSITGGCHPASQPRTWARLLGYRRDLCPDVDIPDSENWAVFVMTDDGHPPAAETVRTIKALGATAPTT